MPESFVFQETQWASKRKAVNLRREDFVMNKLMLNLDTWLCIDLNVNISSAVLLMFFLIEVWFIYNAVLISSVQECHLVLHVYTYICIYVCDTVFFIFWFFNTVFLISLRGQHHDTKLYMCLFLKHNIIELHIQIQLPLQLSEREIPPNVG